MRTSLAIAVLLASLLTGCGPTIGDPCTTSVECGPGAQCLNKDYAPGGYCTIGCKADEAGLCPTGSTCVRDGVSRGNAACFRTCLRTADCRPGYICRPINGSSAICVGLNGF
jgi:serine protease